MNRTSIIILAAVLLCCALPPATGAAPEEPPVGGIAPAGQWDGAPLRPAVKQPEPLWSLRTGFRKGITDQVHDDEVFAGPDGAVLRNGLFAEWTGLLAEFQESYALVAPDNVAGLAGTKPYLVIPSGGLAGLAASMFFKAGLAEYVRSGGIVLCFSQQNGGDYAALPVPDGATLEAAGWAQDAGPLFRSSLVQDSHPVLAAVRTAKPAVETDGYLRTVPGSSRVLLARRDGFPTLVLYPYGGGWVAVTALMSDRTFAQGLLDNEEKALVRGLVLWAKSGGRIAQLAPGGQFQASLELRGPEQGEAALARIMVMGTEQDRPLDDRIAALALRSGQTGSLPFTYSVPGNAPPGIYHVEYVLLDERRRPLSPQAESGNGWFAVLPQTPPPARIARSPQPLPGLPVRFSALPVIEQTGDKLRIGLDTTRTSGPAGTYDLFVRIAGQETSFTMAGDREIPSVDVSAGQAGGRIPYALYHGSGRSLARGSAAADLPQKAGIGIDRSWHLPGQKVRVSVKGMGLGAVTLTGLGSVLREHLSKDRVFEVPVPQSLPAGSYPLAWEFETRTGARQEGELSVTVRGAQAVCTGVTITQRTGGKDGTIAASLRISSSEAIAAVLTIEPVSPGGKAFPAVERTVQLAAGDQDIALSLPFQPDEAGIWSLRYALSTRLPEGPGFPHEPVVLASGRAFFDAGDTAVLGMHTDQPVYYESSGPGKVMVLLYGSGAVKVEVSLDGKRLRKETVEARGVAILSVPFADLAPGPRAAKAVASGNHLASSRELRFLYGARLPDLAASLKTSELSAPALAVGIGVMNKGRVASGAVDVSLYEGDPDKDGTLIKTVPVPPLPPGKQHIFIVSWPLARKAGPRTLVALVDPESRTAESGRGNNRAIVSLTVPDLLLSLAPERSSYRADEPARYTVRIINFSDRTLRQLNLDLQTADPSGRKVSQDSVPLGDLAPGDERTIERTLAVPVPQEGIYLVSAVVAADRPVESDSLGIPILPTLLLKGSLEGTPPVAASCRPFAIRYHVRNAGNVQPTNGSLKLEVRSADQKQLLYAQQLPFSLDAGTHRIERLEVPRGAYRLTARASAVNQQRGLTADFLLADQPFTVAAPVEVRRSSAPFPRVLVWYDSDAATTIQRAIADKLLKEAFSPETVLLRTVTGPDDFTSEAQSGQYNVYVLVDVDPAPDTAEVLRSGLAKGRGAVLAGSRGGMPSLAEALGFRLGSPLPGSSTSISIPADSGLGITGTVPVTGRLLPPRKRGARIAATLPDGQPALLVDTQDTGRAVILPFPLVQSAQAMGGTDLYSLLLRSSVLAAAPDREEPGGIVSEQLLVSSLSGTAEQARFVEVLPPGTKVLWTNVPAVPKDGTLVFEVTVDAEPRRILSLFRHAVTGGPAAPLEMFTECGGTFVSQGKVE